MSKLRRVILFTFLLNCLIAPVILLLHLVDLWRGQSPTLKNLVLFNKVLCDCIRVLALVLLLGLTCAATVVVVQQLIVTRCVLDVCDHFLGGQSPLMVLLLRWLSHWVLLTFPLKSWLELSFILSTAVAVVAVVVVGVTIVY